MKKLSLCWMVTLWICSIFSVKAQTTIYEHGAEITSINQISDGTLFVMKMVDKYMCFPNDHNASLMEWSSASSSHAFYFKLESPQPMGDKAVPDEISDKYIIRVLDGNRNYWGYYGVANSYLNQTGWVTFTLGLNNQWGQDKLYGGVWDLKYVQGEGWTLYNYGCKGYANNTGGPSENPQYWTLYFADDLSSMINNAEAISGLRMNSVISSELLAAIDKAKNATSDTESEAYFELRDAMAKAKPSINFYASLESLYNSMNNLDDSGKAKLAKDNACASFLAAWQKCELDETVSSQAYKDNTKEGLKAATLAQTTPTPGANMTIAIVNPSFETGNLDGWESDNGGQAQSNQAFSGHTDAIYFEVFALESQLSNGSLKQTIKGLPNGKYTLTAEMQNVKNYEPKNDRCTGYYLVANNDITEVTDPGNKVSVTTIVTDGNLTIGAVIDKCTGNWVCADNFQLTYLGATGDDNSNIPGTTVSGTYKWGTFISQVNRLLPEGLEAYTCTGITGHDELMLEEATYIKANTAYILKNTTGEDIVIPDVKAVSKAVETSYTTDLLTGSYVQADVPANSYILQSQNGKTGFYLCKTTGLSVGKNRCYLTLPDGSQKARSFIFNEDGATGVPTLKPETLDKLSNGKIYDVNGRELKSQQKGINIINGRKVNVR